MNRSLKTTAILVVLVAIGIGMLLPGEAGAVQYVVKVRVWDRPTQSWMPYTQHTIVLRIDGVMYLIDLPRPDNSFRADFPAPRNECLVWVGSNRWNAFTYHRGGGRPDEPGTLGGIRRNGNFDDISIYIKPIR